MMVRRIAAILAIITLLALDSMGQDFYNVIGATNPASLASWTNNIDGTPGTQPPNFSSNGQTFIIREGTSMSLATAWVITGDDVGLEIYGTLTVNTGGGVDLASNVFFRLGTVGVYNHNTSSNIAALGQLMNKSSVSIEFFFEEGSTVNFNTSGTHTIAQTFDENAMFDVNVRGVGTIITIASGGSLGIAGNFEIEDGCTVILAEGSLLYNAPIFGGMTTSGTGVLRTLILTSLFFPSAITWSFTVEYAGNPVSPSNQTIAAGTYQNITCSGTGGRNVAAGSLIIVENNWLTCPLLTYTIGNNATIEFSSPIDLSIPNLPYRNLTISGAGIKSIQSNVTVAQTLSINDNDSRLSINGNTLRLQGIVNMSGALIGSSTSNLEILGTTTNQAVIRFSTTSGHNQLRDFLINRTGTNGGAVLYNNLDIIRRFTLTRGILFLNGQVMTLKSTSIASTAQAGIVGAVGTTSIDYSSSGQIRVERFIPNGRRAYRDIGSSGIYTDQSVFVNWQENGLAPAGFGTHITGIVGAFNSIDVVTGLDRTSSGARSFHQQINGVWSDITNTNTLRLNPYQGYRVLIRGDRNTNLATLPTPTNMSGATTLRSSGRMVYGDITYTTSGVSSSRGDIVGIGSSSYQLNPASNGFSLIANPFPTIVDWDVIRLASTNILETYWYWDPALGTNGAYATRNGATNVTSGGSSINDFLQPGMAIFVRNSAASPVLVIGENAKNPDQTLLSIFSDDGTISHQLPIVLRRNIDGEIRNMDGVTLALGQKFKNDFDQREDAQKFTNPGENIGIVHGTRMLSIDARDIPNSSLRVPLRIWQSVRNTDYVLSISNEQELHPSTVAMIEDKHLKKVDYIHKGQFDYPFTVTNDTGSQGFRFQVIYKKIVEALQKQANVEVLGSRTIDKDVLRFKNSKEDQVLFYQVEYSLDGSHFIPVGSRIKPKSNLNSNEEYRFNADLEEVQRGKDIFYRVVLVNWDAEMKYSNVIKLASNKSLTERVRVFSNPIRTPVFNIEISGILEGNYQVRLVNDLGQILLNQNINHSGGIVSYRLDVSKYQLKNGIYRLQLLSSKSDLIEVKSVIVQL